jgi:hypothetical protein
MVSTHVFKTAFYTKALRVLGDALRPRQCTGRLLGLNERRALLISTHVCAGILR